MPETFLVITSVASSDNRVLQTFASECPKHNIPFIVIGDAKSPSGFDLENCEFYSLELQKALPFKLAQSLPESKYSRKNLGYLLAMQQGADTIIETDDDNFPTAAFWNVRTPKRTCRLTAEERWINVYRYYTAENIWPRGFALEHLRDDFIPIGNPVERVYCPIQQGLCDENPDVDAIHRLAMSGVTTFSRSGNIALGRGSWCPFNSQNTTWFREAFPLMYLPSWCNFRMTDIWRSYVAQRIAWTNGWSVLFHDANVFQQRNEHNLLKDFEDEIPGYLNSGMICRELMKLDLKEGISHLFDNMKKCYETFIRRGLISEEEWPLLEDWNRDCARLL